jgi:signal transduction histidine kinase
MFRNKTKQSLPESPDSVGPWSSFRQLPLSQVSLSFGIALLLATLALSTDLFRVEAFLYDLRMKLKGTDSIQQDIVLIAMGERDEQLETANFHSIETHEQTLRRVLDANPKAVAFLNKFDASEIEAKPQAAENFVGLGKAAIARGIPVALGTEVDLSGEVIPAYPLSLLPHFPSILHKDGTMFAEDKVMRRALLTVMDQPTLPLFLSYPHLDRAELLQQAKKVRGAYYYEPAESWHVLIRYPANTGILESPFPRVSLSEVLSGNAKEKLRGKIVLVETLRKDAMNDFAYTPYSREIYSNPRIVVHASILNTLLSDNGLIEAPGTIDIALTFLLALVLALITVTMSPTRGVLGLLMLSGGVFLTSAILFRLGYWLPLVHPLLAMFFTYYLIVPYRAILEYKKRWEVQEKHDLLVKVEEMKGNFMSLMSHDLKTPVARIQGLSELLLRKGNLSSSQTEELQQILDSTESLDKFISKILNLTRVESQDVKINLRSKDVNKLVEQVAQKLSFQAQAKSIKVDLDLEPLFPIYLDPALIIQVLTNLIDNAIKYSPRGSQVRIRTVEKGDFVEIAVEDTGPGIPPEESERLFSKFFRGKAGGEAGSGSGLGLYLAQYFIDLHKGTLRFERPENGSGSRFVLKLPMEQGREEFKQAPKEREQPNV